MTRPFRFSVTMLGFTTGQAWRESCRRAEELGYDAVHVADHLGMPGPFTAIAAAAEVTERVRLGTLVLNAGFWNPALLAREVATCDQLTGGRLELGLGTGYIKAEHDTAGLPFGSPGERVDHLASLIGELKRLLADEKHVPQPAQHPVPLIIGGNGDRVLQLAAEHAQVAAFTGGRQAPGQPEGTLELVAMEGRVATYREFAAERSEPAELNMLLQRVAVTDDPAAAVADFARYSPALSEKEVLEHPALLAGTVRGMADQLRARREQFGFSYISVLEPCMETLAPVMAELRGS